MNSSPRYSLMNRLLMSMLMLVVGAVAQEQLLSKSILKLNSTTLVDIALNDDCEKRYFDVPTTMDLRNISWHGSAYAGIQITGRLEQRGLSIHTSATAVIAPWNDPICSLVWCLNPCQDGRKYDYVKVWDQDLSGKCIHYGFLTYNDINDLRRYRNGIEIKVEPRKDCRSGLDTRRSLPNGTVMWIEDVRDWAKDDDVLAVYYVVGTSRPVPLPDTRRPSEDLEGWLEGDLFWHQIVQRHGGRIFSNLTKGLSVDATDFPLSSDDSFQCELRDVDPTLGDSGRFPKSGVFAAILGIALAIVTQPRGSLLHSSPAPRFWRLVPGFALYECITISFLALLILPQTRNLKYLCASLMIFRDPVYQEHKHRTTRDIVHKVISEAGLNTSRLISTASIVPIILIILKASSVKGAPLFTWYCLIYAAPYLLIQLVIFMQPHDPWEKDTVSRIETSLEKIRVLSRGLGLEDPVKEDPDRQISGNSSASVLVAEVTIAVQDAPNSVSDAIVLEEQQDITDISVEPEQVIFLHSSVSASTLSLPLARDNDMQETEGSAPEPVSTEDEEQHSISPSPKSIILDMWKEGLMIWTVAMAFIFTIYANGHRVPNIFWSFGLPYPWNLRSSFYHITIAALLTYFALAFVVRLQPSHAGPWKWHVTYILYFMDMVHVVFWGLSVMICVSFHDELGTNKASWLDWLG